jgi:Uma2 family endonuclease
MAQLVTQENSAPPDASLNAATLTPTLDVPLVLRMPASLRMDEEQFFDFCQRNENLRIERSAEGDLIIMPPAGGYSGNQNFQLTVLFGVWANQDGTGEGFDSSTGFKLPNGATRSPDVAWVKSERLAALTPQQTERFIPLCPDFVIELRSSTDRLSTLKSKMKEYMANGARLGWLLDPKNRHVYVYRPGVPVERLDDPPTVSGDPELPGFVLDVQAIFIRRF